MQAPTEESVIHQKIKQQLKSVFRFFLQVAPDSLPDHDEEWGVERRHEMIRIAECLSTGFKESAFFDITCSKNKNRNRCRGHARN